MNKPNGTLFVITGSSGAGKHTVLSLALPELCDIHYSVSVTTRPNRPGEVDGVDYFFISHEQFDRLRAEDALLESAEYVGNGYGTPAEAVEAALADGEDVVLEIEVEGAKQVKQRKPDVVMVFIAPPGFEELKKRLHMRGTETDETIEQRVAAARTEYQNIGMYDYIVINDNPRRAADELKAIIVANRCKTEKRKNFIK